MNKIMSIVIVLVLLAGCAGPQNYSKLGSPYMGQAIKINKEISNCIKPPDDVGLAISFQKEPNAYYNSNINKIVLTEGIFYLRRDALKFVLAHEIAHINLGHVASRRAVSAATTGVFMVAGFFIPGVGLLNHAVNPAIVRNYSKTQETEADLAAYRACLCMGMTKEEIIFNMRAIEAIAGDTGGGFWDYHPSWADRIKAVQEAP